MVALVEQSFNVLFLVSYQLVGEYGRGLLLALSCVDNDFYLNTLYSSEIVDVIYFFFEFVGAHTAKMDAQREVQATNSTTLTGQANTCRRPGPQSSPHSSGMKSSMESLFSCMINFLRQRKKI